MEKREKENSFGTGWKYHPVAKEHHLVPVGNFNRYQRHFSAKKRCSGRESEPRLRRLKHVEKPLRYLEISVLNVPPPKIKGKVALDTGLFASPGAKGYFISRPLGT